MSSLNKALLIGNLGKDPEIRSLSNGSRVCNLSIATSENWTEKSTGERKSRTEWHKVTIWNDNLVTVAEKYLRKGAKVYIEGQLETRKWQDQSGQDKYSTEVVIKQFRGELQMLDGRKESDDGYGQSQQTVHTAPTQSSGDEPYRGTSYGADYPPIGNSAAIRDDGRRPATAAEKAELDDSIPF